MLFRFLKCFLYIILYMAAIAVVGMLVAENVSENIGIGLIVVGCVGFIPFFFWLSGRVFSWQPKTTNAVGEAEMRSLLESLEIDGQPFELTAVDNYYVMTPRYFEFSYANFMQLHRLKEAYYMKLWVHPEKQTVRFKDYLITTTSDFSPTTLAKNFKGQSGVVMTSIKTLSSDGELRSFSNGKLHEKLVDTVTGNGWKLLAKMM